MRTLDDHVDFLDIDCEYGFSSAVRDGEDLWLSPFEGNTFVRMKLGDNSYVLIEVPESKVDRTFSDIIQTRDRIYAIPWFGNKMVCINKEDNHIIEINGFSDVLNTEHDSELVSAIICNGHILSYNSILEQLLDYSIEDDESEQKRIVLSGLLDDRIASKLTLDLRYEKDLYLKDFLRLVSAGGIS